MKIEGKRLAKLFICLNVRRDVLKIKLKKKKHYYVASGVEEKTAHGRRDDS